MEAMSAPVLHAVAPNLACRQNMPDFIFGCPGCGCEHGVWTSKPAANRAQWKWNGDMVKPTFSPSLLITWDTPEGTPTRRVCHSYVTDGKIQFLGDCTHALANKTVPLEPIA